MTGGARWENGHVRSAVMTMIREKATRMAISSPAPLLKNFLRNGSVQFAVPQETYSKGFSVIPFSR